MLKSKTMWGAITAIVGSLAAYFLDEIELGAMLQICVTSGLSVFLKHAVKKSEDASTAS
jgi:hypothetical protein|tara:strand:- start:230 stop:406 length:177 start_codon:yes stop_codon:yes gene_type:complete